MYIFVVKNDYISNNGTIEQSGCIIILLICFHLHSSHSDAVTSKRARYQITGVSIVCSIVCSGANRTKHQSSATMAFLRGIHRWPLKPPHKGPVTRKMFPFDDVIMLQLCLSVLTRTKNTGQVVWRAFHIIFSEHLRFVFRSWLLYPVHGVSLDILYSISLSKLKLFTRNTRNLSA